MQERFNKDLEEIKKSQYIMNNAINKIKNTLGGTNRRITEAEDRISEVEDSMVEIMNHKSPRRRRQKKDHEKILEEKIVEKFPKMRKEIVTPVQETQRVPNRINPR